MDVPRTQLVVETAAPAEGTVTVLSVSGDLDLGNAEQLRQAVMQEAKPGRPIIIDLSGVMFCDSTGLGALIGVHRRVTAAGGRLALSGLQPRVVDLLDVTGVGRLIPNYPTVDEALAATGG